MLADFRDADKCVHFGTPVFSQSNQMQHAPANLAPGHGMTRREEWQKVLQAELMRWSSLPWDRVLAELRNRAVYEVVTDGGRFQVEVELLEDTPEYLHVNIAVDDGSLPASIHPVSESFISKKSRRSP